MGYAVVAVQTPDATSAEITQRVLGRVREIVQGNQGHQTYRERIGPNRSF